MDQNNLYFHTLPGSERSSFQSSSAASGNVLFLILIAVALFAALSYTVLSATNQGGNGVTKEQARLAASKILQYGTSTKVAAERLKITNGCIDSTLDFGNDLFKSASNILYNTTNVNSPADGRCSIYKAQGGNVLPMLPSAEALDSTLVNAGHSWTRVFQVKGIGSDGAVGTVSANDIVLRTIGINKTTCVAINDLLGIENPNGNPPNSTITGTSGSYTNGSLTGSAIICDPATNGRPTFCYPDGSGLGYTFLQVLIER